MWQPLVLSGGGHQSSKRRFMTARVILKAVAFSEINLNRLKARKLAGSHLRSKRRFMTARVILKAVAFSEINLNRLKAGKAGWQSSKFKTPPHDCPGDLEVSSFL